MKMIKHPDSSHQQPEQRDANRVFRPALRVTLAVPHRHAKKQRRAYGRERKREALSEQTKQRDFAKRKRDLFKRFTALESFLGFH